MIRNGLAIVFSFPEQPSQLQWHVHRYYPIETLGEYWLTWTHHHHSFSTLDFPGRPHEDNGQTQTKRARHPPQGNGRGCDAVLWTLKRRFKSIRTPPPPASTNTNHYAFLLSIISWQSLETFCTDEFTTDKLQIWQQTLATSRRSLVD